MHRSRRSPNLWNHKPPGLKPRSSRPRKRWPSPNRRCKPGRTRAAGLARKRHGACRSVGQEPLKHRSKNGPRIGPRPEAESVHETAQQTVEAAEPPLFDVVVEFDRADAEAASEAARCRTASRRRSQPTSASAEAVVTPETRSGRRSGGWRSRRPAAIRETIAEQPAPEFRPLARSRPGRTAAAGAARRTGGGA